MKNVCSRAVAGGLNLSAGDEDPVQQQQVLERIPVGRDPKKVESGGRTFLKLAELELVEVHSKKTISAIHRAESGVERNRTML